MQERSIMQNVLLLCEIIFRAAMGRFITILCG